MLLWSRQNVGAEFLGGSDQRVGTETEHARIPRVVAGSDVARSRFAIGFFDEGSNVAAVRQCFAHADVAETGFRRRGRDSECDAQDRRCVIGVAASDSTAGERRRHAADADGAAGVTETFVTSIAGSRVHPFAGAAYSISKAAAAALTREMAADFGPDPA